MDDATVKQLLIQIGGILLAAIVGAGAVAFWRTRDSKKKLEARVVDLETQLQLISGQIAPYNTAFQTLLIKQLTHYHTPRMDALLVKLGGVNLPPTITEAEEKELWAALEQRTRDMGPEITEDERDAALILPVLMRRVKREAIRSTANPRFTDIQVIGSLFVGEE